MNKTCGDFGGKTRDGSPCKRDAGWGREGVTTGPCRDHVQEQNITENESNASASSRDSRSDGAVGRKSPRSEVSLDDLLLEFLHHYYIQDDRVVQERQNWFIYGIFDSYFLGMNHSFDQFTDLWTEFIEKRGHSRPMRQLGNQLKKKLTEQQRLQLIWFGLIMKLLDDKNERLNLKMRELARSLDVDFDSKFLSNGEAISSRAGTESELSTKDDSLHRNQARSEVENRFDQLETKGYVRDLFEAILDELDKKEFDHPAQEVQQWSSLSFILTVSNSIPPGWKASDSLFEESNSSLQNHVEDFLDARSKWPDRPDPNLNFWNRLTRHVADYAPEPVAEKLDDNSLIMGLAGLLIVISITLWFLI